jgi:nicotinate phosphoribosyltransferase
MPWVTDENAALLTDLYELTMLQAYWREGMHGESVFSLHARRLPGRRNYLLACGLADVLDYLERLRFSGAAIDRLSALAAFEPAFLDWLATFRFTGSVWAVPEGTPVFGEEPLLEIVAPLPQAQVVETFVLNQVHFQTVLASKASRVVQAAAGRRTVDFGLRRIHGADAGLKAARAFHIAGIDATSNVLAGVLYGVPTAGTMAHSYVQAHAHEIDAFRAFSRMHPQTILLVDTYDTLEGVRRVVELARERGEAFAVRGIRLDSGDLAALAFEARRILDEAGLHQVGIFASGGLDEDVMDDIVRAGAPIDAFGIGSGMGVAADAPYLDMAYKLVEYEGRGRTKLSPHKRILPGRKQVFRVEAEGAATGDVIAQSGEAMAGRPLLINVMLQGEVAAAGRVTLDAARAHARAELARLPARVRALQPAAPPYPVRLSDGLQQHWRDLVAECTR